MKKKELSKIRCALFYRRHKILRIMKWNFLFLFLLQMNLSATLYSQGMKISLDLKEASVKEFLNVINRKTNISFLYNAALIENREKITLQVKDGLLDEVLRETLSARGLTYSYQNGAVILKKMQEAAQQNNENPVVRGRVVDNQKQPLPGVTVSIKGSTRGTSTDGQGRYSIPVRENDVVVFSFIGKKVVEVTYTGQAVLDVLLEEVASDIDEVVVTGMFQRKAESFSGSAVTFKQEDLKRVGNQNLIASLKNLDPAFIVTESLEFGSDPNRLPEITMRGKTSLPDVRGEYAGNPNQPLFILDGFESSLETIYDLDINRINSITLLKDAAAKAIYGAKAANGVIVIETVLPKSGNLYVSYSGSLDITAPDLTSYNLANSAEKLQAEWLAEKYVSSTGDEQAALLEEYYHLQKEVERGVDTYWLSQPLRTGVGQKHSLSLSGGDSQMRYDASVSYNDTKGAMKGSDRRTVTGNITLAYRYNNLNFRNNLSVSFNRGDNSPYGSFADFANMNPYWRTHDESGHLIKYYEYGAYDTKVFNPLYNGELEVVGKSTYATITENLYVEWTVRENLKLTGRIGYTRSNTDSDRFLPADHTKFATGIGSYPNNAAYIDRGEYTRSNAKSSKVAADFGVSYSLHKNKHLVFANMLWNIETTDSESTTISVVGFPSPLMDYITAGNRYVGTTPGGSESTSRSIGLVGSANYSYDNRFLLDLSYRATASSQFGAQNRWGHFWSVGAGWNLHHESFIRSLGCVDLFKIRGSLGYTGSQNVDAYMAIATYGYFTDRTYNGGDLGLYLMGVANDKLQWQQQYDRNVGVDLTLFNKLSLRFDTYSNLTTNLLTDVDLAPSTGFTNFKENLGEMKNTGYQASAQMRVYSDPRKRAYASLSVGIAHNSNKLTKISDALRSVNEEQDEKLEEINSDRKPVVRFEEGQSMTAIWAVRSKGIDPVTGREVFIKKDGSITQTWDTDDQVVVGDTEAKVTGNVSASAEYMGFSVNLAFNFKYGGQIYNSTLLNKIENVDVASVNVDRRVLYDRWNTPGVEAKYKSITQRTSTYPTSRFVEDIDEFVFSSISLGYELSYLDFIKRSPIDRLRVSFNMNDIGRISTVKQERGTEYPFARAFSFSISASF